jgi:primosomal protein N''
MADVSQDLLNELLRKLHQRFDKVDHAIGDLRADNLLIRNQMHLLQGEVNNLRGTLAHIEGRLDRIENRLELRELSEGRQAPFNPPN